MAQFLNVQVPMVSAVVLICMTAFFITASARQPLPSSSSQEGVVLYWEEKLHHVPMPPMLTSMLTPLTANDARFLLSKLTAPALTSYLPSNAAAFCKITRIVCDRTRYDASQAKTYQQTGNGAFLVKSENLGPGGFFREKQTLVKGAQIELHVDKLEKDDGRYDQPRAFLPRRLVHLFPFTKEGLPQLVHTLGISKQALPIMQETVSACFSPHGGLLGEVKSCPTSLEAMADFVASTMGSQKPIGVLDVSYGQHVTQDSTERTQIVLDVKIVKSNLRDKYVACHDMFFPFRVFYCHYLPQAKLFVATLQASDGSIHNRAAVCHYDTSSWNPNHVSFSDLGTKPGESEACHWMADSGLVFLHQ